MKIGSAFVRAVIIAGALIGASSCGHLPAYESVPAGQPAAEMRLLKSYRDVGFMSSGTQYFSLSTDETCKTARDAATFSWTTGHEKVVRIAPDKSILVWVETVYHFGGSPVSTSKRCLSVVRFTPQDDHAYDVSQPTTIQSPGCGVMIVDRATGVAAPGVVFVRSSPCVEERKSTKG